MANQASLDAEKTCFQPYEIGPIEQTMFHSILVYNERVRMGHILLV